MIDTILDEPREWFFRKLDYKRDKTTGMYYERESGTVGKLSYLLQCTWCAGFWISFLIYWAYTREIHLIEIFAVAGVQGIIHALEPDDE